MEWDNKETTAALQHSLWRDNAKDAENRRQQSRGKVEVGEFGSHL